MRWYREDSGVAAYRFTEVIGGLNKLTVDRFVKIVAQSDFTLADLKPVPIRKLRILANSLTREFTTAVVKSQACS